jgi:hypothetical protein
LWADIARRALDAFSIRREPSDLTISARRAFLSDSRNAEVVDCALHFGGVGRAFLAQVAIDTGLKLRAVTETSEGASEGSRAC